MSPKQSTIAEVHAVRLQTSASATFSSVTTCLYENSVSHLETTRSPMRRLCPGARRQTRSAREAWNHRCASWTSIAHVPDRAEFRAAPAVHLLLSSVSTFSFLASSLLCLR